MNHQSLTWI